MEKVTENFQTKYFTNALHLFHEMQWLYNRPVTDILAQGSLDDFPEDWLTALYLLDYSKLNDFVVKKTIQPEWPDSLKAFVERCRINNLLPIIEVVQPVQLPKSFTKGLSYKKQHEIMHLTQLIHNECASHGITVIVDVGAGLGYVCQLLYHLHGYKVLGLERNEDNVNSAKTRQRKMYGDSLSHVKYTCCDITSESGEVIESICKTEFPDDTNICLVGLHACGDLSIHATRIFSRIKIADILILISCCYHKLAISTSIKITDSMEKQYFHNFPLSRCFKNIIEDSKFDVGSFLRQPFLRLACQEPADRWNDMSEKSHEQHALHVLARAVLQLYASKNGYSLKKRVQKATRNSQCVNFESYVRDSALRYYLISVVTGEECNLAMHEKNIFELWDKHSHKMKDIEIYTGLQLMLQAPAESLLLHDRLCWMKEQGLKATIKPVMNNCLSPRSYAIVSQKK